MTTLLLALLGCTTEITTSLPVCDVTLTAAEPTTGVPGAEVVLTGGPLTDNWDTAVYFGTERALVTAIDRDSCDDCDACRETNICTACGDCDACDLLCTEDCVETARVEVPQVDAGSVDVLLFNAYGVSSPLVFTVDGAEDTGSTSGSDTGESENASDSGSGSKADSGAGNDSGDAEKDTAGSGN
jgi:hypothetical protein